MKTSVIILAMASVLTAPPALADSTSSFPPGTPPDWSAPSAIDRVDFERGCESTVLLSVSGFGTMDYTVHVFRKGRTIAQDTYQDKMAGIQIAALRQPGRYRIVVVDNVEPGKTFVARFTRKR